MRSKCRSGNTLQLAAEYLIETKFQRNIAFGKREREKEKEKGKKRRHLSTSRLGILSMRFCAFPVLAVQREYLDLARRSVCRRTYEFFAVATAGKSCVGK